MARRILRLSDLLLIGLASLLLMGSGAGLTWALLQPAVPETPEAVVKLPQPLLPLASLLREQPAFARAYANLWAAQKTVLEQRTDNPLPTLEAFRTWNAACIARTVVPELGPLTGLGQVTEQAFAHLTQQSGPIYDREISSAELLPAFVSLTNLATAAANGHAFQLAQ